MIAFTLALLLAPSDYAAPKLLIEPATLAKDDLSKFVVLDVRDKSEYKEGHLPGAHWADLSTWSKLVLTGDNAEARLLVLGKLGIDGKRPVAIYCDANSRDAARAWWILRYWGVEDVRLLNGGWRGWKKVGKVDTSEPKVVEVKPTLKKREGLLVSKEQLLKELKDGKVGQIIDARTKDEHCGIAKTAKRNGTIPEAKHLDWVDTIDAKTGRFKTAPELEKLLKDAGIDPSKPATTYCQSGGRAAVMAFVMELMGGKPARNYYRSWSEWGNDSETPIKKKE